MKKRPRKRRFRPRPWRVEVFCIPRPGNKYRDGWTAWSSYGSFERAYEQILKINLWNGRFDGIPRQSYRIRYAETNEVHFSSDVLD